MAKKEIRAMKDIAGSSNIEAIGHENGTLSVRFKGGAVYDYADFPADKHAQWMAHIDEGKSAGGWFHQHVKLSNHIGKRREPQND
jgi:hypothetical protein